MRDSASRSGGGGSSAFPWIGRAIQLATMAAWPLLVVVGARVAGPRRVAVAILVLLIPEVVVALLGGVRSRRALWSAAGAACLAAAAAVVDDDRILFAWPVIVSVALLVAFGSSLRGVPVVERFARLQEASLNPAEVRYCRTVTWVWCGFFALNAVVATTLALAASRETWALYCGVLAYVAIGGLLAAEYVVRKVRFGRFGNGPVDRVIAYVLSRGARS
jgi:uncharacterized membrane protein